MKFNQAKFFDTHPVLFPWPRLLRLKGFRKVYRLRDAKLKEIFDRLGLVKGQSVLDVGCGEGLLLARLVKSYQVSGVGVDLSPGSIQRARLNSSREINFLVTDARRLPFSADQFDLVFSLDTLEHIERPKKAILEMVRVVKPGGCILIHALNKKQKFTWNWWLNQLGVDVYRGWAHDPQLFLEPERIRCNLQKLGLQVEKVVYFHAFFTLLVDEIIMVLVSLFSKLGWFEEKTKISRWLGEFFFFWANLFSRAVLSIMDCLDQPWYRRQIANSFFLVARKS